MADFHELDVDKIIDAVKAYASSVDDADHALAEILVALANKLRNRDVQFTSEDMHLLSVVAASEQRPLTPIVEEVATATVDDDHSKDETKVAKVTFDVDAAHRYKMNYRHPPFPKHTDWIGDVPTCSFCGAEYASTDIEGVDPDDLVKFNTLMGMVKWCENCEQWSGTCVCVFKHADEPTVFTTDTGLQIKHHVRTYYTRAIEYIHVKGEKVRGSPCVPLSRMNEFIRDVVTGEVDIHFWCACPGHCPAETNEAVRKIVESYKCCKEGKNLVVVDETDGERDVSDVAEDGVVDSNADLVRWLSHALASTSLDEPRKEGNGDADALPDAPPFVTFPLPDLDIGEPPALDDVQADHDESQV